MILAITLPVAPDFTVERGKMHAKDLRDFHHREPKLLVNLELGALLGGKLGVVQKIGWF